MTTLSEYIERKKEIVVIIGYMPEYISCSLLIPCYNAAPFLNRLLENIAQQEAPFAEVIFYDDGSTDTTSDILQERGFAVLKGARNLGPSYARNQLLKAAKCEWVHFHDADDLMDKAFLKEMSDQVQGQDTVYLCQSDWIDAVHGNIQMHWRYEQRELDQDTVAAVLKKPVSTINAIYPIVLLEKIKGFDESVSCWEDADLHVRIASAGYAFKVLDRVLVQALRRTDSSSSRQGECEECRYKLLLSYEKLLGEQYHKIIASEYEQSARRALAHSNRILAKNTLHACSRLGGDPPVTSNFFLQFLKKILPAYFVLELQSFFRKSKRLNSEQYQD